MPNSVSQVGPNNAALIKNNTHMYGDRGVRYRPYVYTSTTFVCFNIGSSSQCFFLVRKTTCNCSTSISVYFLVSSSMKKYTWTEQRKNGTTLKLNSPKKHKENHAPLQLSLYWFCK